MRKSFYIAATCFIFSFAIHQTALADGHGLDDNKSGSSHEAKDKDDHDDDNDSSICASSNLTGKALGWCENYCGNQCGTLGGTVKPDSKAEVPGKVCSQMLAKLKAYLGQSADFPCNIVQNNFTLSPSLSFSSQQFGVPSAPQNVLLANTSSAVLPIDVSKIVISGSDAASFSQTNNCLSTLAAGASCIINVVFSPQLPATLPPAGTVVSYLAKLGYTDAASSKSASVNLDGKATAEPQVAVTAPGDFGSICVNQFSPQAAVTITNATNASSNLVISSISITGDFSKTTDCDNANIPPGGSCTFNVTFAPTAGGSLVGSITVNDNAPSTPQIASLTGTGNVSAICIIR